jgi:hypothetical protein
MTDYKGPLWDCRVYVKGLHSTRWDLCRTRRCPGYRIHTAAHHALEGLDLLSGQHIMLRIERAPRMNS